jgi:AraC family transcriptional regulator of adaptative response/methylated-DNA-[protein]-cysteine methyltransferase
MVRQLCRYIQEGRDGPPTLSQLSGLVGVSPGHLHRVFKRVMGITPRQYFVAFRQDRLKARLKEGWGVAGAMYDAGYGSSSRLYEGSSERLGMSPASYRRGGRGASIAYTTAACPLGRLLVAATERGVCAVKLGDTDAELESALRQEYPAAEIRPEIGALGESVGALLRLFDGVQPALDLPLDIMATAFQMRVWEHLRAIPYGHTNSYQQVAQALGQPGGARAVARACATNPVPLLVPCHRVVRQDGALGGYRYGAKRKAFLLDRERAAVQEAAEPADGPEQIIQGVRHGAERLG